jgi:steroid delta-isomerase-like uncharacterized protein
MKQEDNMSPQESAALARRLLEGITAHDLDIFAQNYAQNSETVTVPTGERELGPEGGRRSIQRWLTAFPDMKLEVVNVIGGEDAAAVEIKFTGTNTGPLASPLGELPATGKRVEEQGCVVFKFQRGKVISERDYFDYATLAAQLGIGAEQPSPTTAEQRPIA